MWCIVGDFVIILGGIMGMLGIILVVIMGVFVVVLGYVLVWWWIGDEIILK